VNMISAAPISEPRQPVTQVTIRAGQCSAMIGKRTPRQACVAHSHQLAGAVSQACRDTCPRTGAVERARGLIPVGGK
jgi:hypothetical protein